MRGPLVHQYGPVAQPFQGWAQLTCFLDTGWKACATDVTNFSKQRCVIPDLGGLTGARVLITGGAGMIGSTIAHLAVAQGARVTILDAMLPLYGGNRFNLHGILDQIQFIEGDIRDLDLMRRVVPGYDYIFNLAGQVSYVDSNIEPLLDLDINCKGHLQMLEACRLENPRARLLFASSRFVYGRIEYNPVDEGHPFNCLSIYGIHKKFPSGNGAMIKNNNSRAESGGGLPRRNRD
jgi:hypothetical protein